MTYVAGEPNPHAWPLRVKPYRAKAVHAGRVRPGLHPSIGPEITTACCQWFLSERQTREQGRVLDPSEQITCKGCARRLDKPFSRSEAMAFSWQDSETGGER